MRQGCFPKYWLFIIFLEFWVIFLRSNFDWTLFDKGVTAHLPVYARPAFIRVTKEIPMTSTFKQQKGVLSKDGFDPSLIQEHGDEVYYYNAKERTVTKLEKELFDQIQSGKVQV